MSPGDEILLRRWREEDVPAVAAACDEEEIGRWMVYPFPFTESDARQFVDLHAAAQSSFAVVDPPGTLLGAVWVRDVSDGRGQIGYWTVREARGRGVATAALRQLVDWVFERSLYARLQLFVHPTNLASKRVAEGAGFRREGIVRGWMELQGERADLVMYGLLAGDER